MNPTETTVVRTIPAESTDVFDAWLDPKCPGGLWSAADRLILNAVVDGLFYLAVKHEGRTWPHYGRFLRMDRPGCVEHTWVSEATKGVESIVTVTFEPKGNRTEVTLRHSGLPDEETGRAHQDGWTWGLSKLAEHFQAKPART